MVLYVTIAKERLNTDGETAWMQKSHVTNIGFVILLQFYLLGPIASL